MPRSSEKLIAAGKHQLIFSTSYGSLPRFFWYAFIPFLLLASSAFLIQALWFGQGLLIKNVRVTPTVIVWVICPAIWGLCGLLAGIGVYGWRNPQFINVTTRGVSLPKGRFSSEVISIAWDNLRVDFQGQNLVGWDVYELRCTDERDDTSIRVSSMLFSNLDDFATLTMLLARHMGQEWTVRGFWPGTIRGTQIDHPIFDRD